MGSSIRIGRVFSFVPLAAVILLSGCQQAQAPAPASGAPDWQMEAQRAITMGEYAVRPDGDGFRATNRAQGLRVGFDAGGLSVRARAGSGEVRLSLESWGRAGEMVDAEAAPAEEGPCLAYGALDAFGDCLRRVELPRPGLTEWWENRPEGVEHGFTVTAPPEGEGPLVLQLSVVGAQVALDGDEARLLRPGGDPLRYAGLAAWDEAGRPLDAWLDEVEGGLAIVVDDEGALGTITVDPLLTTASWTEDSSQGASKFAISVASAGDVNGDGFGDVIIGASAYDNGSTDEGRAFVYLGSAAGLGASASWTAESNQTGAAFGVAVASAGDVNGDGYADVLVGADAYDNGESDEGKAFLYFGSSAGLDTTASWTAESDQATAGFGSAVASAGDINGDGYADVLVGAPNYDNGSADEGRAYLYLGTATGLETTAAWTGESNQGGASFGHRLAGAGDTNGDGYDDVIVSAPTYDNGSTDEGRAYVYLGSAGGLSTSASWTIESDQASSDLGMSVAAAGDVDGDGYADVLVGAYLYNGGSTNEGQVSLFLGSATGLSTLAAWTVESDQSNARMGFSLRSAGDINGDGYGDVIVSAYGYDDTYKDEGRVYVYLGSASGLGTAASWTADGDQKSAGFGYSVASAGDVNGDGFGDVIVGTYLYDSGLIDEGRASVYMGSASGLSSEPHTSFGSDQASAELGFVVAPAGDVNGDGFADAVVGAPLYDDGETDEGAAFVYLGSADGLSSAADWSAEGDQDGAYFGWSAGHGDFDADGYADLIIGAPQYDDGETDEGVAFVYLGSSVGLASSPVWSVGCDQAEAEFGHAVSGAGDVNGDAYDDLIVSARYYDGGKTKEGRVYAYLGGATGPETTEDWTAEGDQTSAIFGFSIASAHDVNGDGYGDIIIGAQGWNNGSTDEGRAVVYYGSASGLSSAEDWAYEPDVANTVFGYSVASAGDVNGDGYSDIVVGANHWTNGESDEGGAFAFYGSATGLSTAVDWSAESGVANTQMGWSVSTAGDINGDGYGDILVGAPYYSDGQSREGRGYLYLGSASGLESSADWTFESNESGAYLGWSVAGLGDVNGDGFGDVMLGAYLSDDGETDEGQAHLFLGNAADGGTGPLSRAVQARHTGTTTPISPGLNAEDRLFDVVMLAAHGHWGNARMKLQVEAKPLGTAFDGSDLAETDVTAGSTDGVEIQAVLEDLDEETAYHWRAREAVDPSHGFPQGWGSWLYGGISGDASGTHLVTTIGLIYIDADGDGYGDPDSAVLGAVSAGYTTNGEDCDDDDDAINPDDLELCDAAGVDEDCDGLSNDEDNDAADPSDWYPDDDEDGYGDEGAAAKESCDQPSGYVADNTDCDDADDAINPDGVETCDGFGDDEDCDGLADETDDSVVDGTTWYNDSDGDGYGDAANTVTTCESAAPPNTTDDDSDCDDAHSSAHPGGAEICDEDDIDEDCDGLSDDADPDVAGEADWYADGDGDGYGAGSATTGCNAPDGTADSDTDCDDGDAAINPAAMEICDPDDTDEDCDGLADEADPGLSDISDWYADSDGDGYGDAAASSAACDQPAGTVADNSDCDDANAAISPAATEICDAIGVDEDCDGLSNDDDPSVTGETTWYTDEDEDGYGDKAAGDRCEAPVGAVATGGDCNDADADFHPGAAETCEDPTDYNCDDSVGYADADGDGHAACLECDDSDATVNPDAVDLPDDGVDQDCDGFELCYADADLDGYRDDLDTLVDSENLACDGEGDASAETPTGDCDDADPAVHPDADELPDDGVDQNCDGAELCYTDADLDGYRDDLDSTVSSADAACDGDGEVGALTPAGDCDDADPSVNPEAEEIPDDDIDQDCDGEDASGAVGKDGCNCAAGGQRPVSGLLLLLGIAVIAARRQVPAINT